MISTKGVLIFDAKKLHGEYSIMYPTSWKEKVQKTVTIPSPSPNLCKDLQIYLTESYWCKYDVTLFVE